MRRRRFGRQRPGDYRDSGFEIQGQRSRKPVVAERSGAARLKRRPRLREQKSRAGGRPGAACGLASDEESTGPDKIYTDLRRRKGAPRFSVANGLFRISGAMTISRESGQRTDLTVLRSAARIILSKRQRRYVRRKRRVPSDPARRSEDYGSSCSWDQMFRQL